MASAAEDDLSHIQATTPWVATYGRLMVPSRQIAWDVLVHPPLDTWLDEMRRQGWYRDVNAPGVRLPNGTIAYQFFHVGHSDEHAHA